MKEFVPQSLNPYRTLGATKNNYETLRPYGAFHTDWKGYKYRGDRLVCAQVHRCTPDNALFDPSVVSTSIPTDFRLVWDNSSTHSAVAHLSEVGGLLGCLIAGYLADLHGRKKIMFAGD